jgi:serine/threonine-protein kinase RsbT
VAIRDEPDLLLMRQLVRECAGKLGFSTLDQTKLLTAASELGRNTLVHGGGGTVCIESFEELDRRLLRMTFEDNGPGIPDIAQAMSDGFTTRRGMGLGLGGSKRLAHEFQVTSEVGKGTRIIVGRWTS